MKSTQYRNVDLNVLLLCDISNSFALFYWWEYNVYTYYVDIIYSALYTFCCEQLNVVLCYSCCTLGKIRMQPVNVGRQAPALYTRCVTAGRQAWGKPFSNILVTLLLLCSCQPCVLYTHTYTDTHRRIHSLSISTFDLSLAALILLYPYV